MMNFLNRILGRHSPAFIWLVSAAQGKQAGRDALGNVYYTGQARKGYTRERRWVLYAGDPEPSMIPPEWHAWMHYQTDDVPTGDNGKSFRQIWQKKHRSNMTGTTAAIYPPGHFKSGGQRPPATGDYHAWTPSPHNTQDRQD